MTDDLVKMCRRLSKYAHAQLSASDLERIADRIEELEAKLEKAVKLIELAIELGRWELNPSFRNKMIDFTEELTGGKDE